MFLCFLFWANIGTPNECDIFKTALTNYDALIKQGIAPEQIIIYGDSLGAAVAVHVASEREAAGVILSAPFLSMQAMASQQMPWFPTSLLLRDKYRSDLKMPTVNEPLLVLHGDADALIHHTQGKALFDLHTQNKDFVLIKNGHHNLWGTDLPSHMEAALLRFTG